MDITKILLVLALFGCATSSPWNVSYLQGAGSSRLSSPAHDRVNGVGVEMVYTQNSLRTYLEVHSQTIPPYHGNDKEAIITLKTTDQTFHAIAHRHAGGQRLLLPADLQQILIDNLLSNQPVTIELQGYRETLSPEHFSDKYHRIKKPSLNVPIQLPFKI